MAITTAGRNHVAQALAGEAVTAFNNASSYLGVGDSSTAFALTQTDLVAATNKLRKAMDATYPTRATNVLTYRATFASTEANFVWAEVGLFNVATAGVMLLREVSALGTKASGSTWVLTHSLTMSI